MNKVWRAFFFVIVFGVGSLSSHGGNQYGSDTCETNVNLYLGDSACTISVEYVNTWYQTNFTQNKKGTGNYKQSDTECGETEAMFDGIHPPCGSFVQGDTVNE